MFLSHQTIEKYIDEGRIVIQPEFDRKDIRAAGVRLHLAKDILVPEPGQTVELGKPTGLKYKEIDLTQEDFFLEPGGFILGATYEAIQTPPQVLAILDGRSTVARLGLTMHLGSCVADGTLDGPHAVTLEIKNAGNFRIHLRYKDPVALMVFVELTEPVTQKSQSQYNGQSKVTPPKSV